MIVRKRYIGESKIRPAVLCGAVLSAVLILIGIWSISASFGRAAVIPEAKAEENRDFDRWSDEHYGQDFPVTREGVPAAQQENTETGYQVFLFDDADLLKPEEETRLLAEMYKITAYGGAAFVSVSMEGHHAGTSTKEYAQKQYLQCFGNNSGILFMIDMSTRQLWISANGEVYRTVTDAYCNTIADNVYTYATKGAYYECAKRVFEQANALLEGRKISQPMKHISNLLLAMALAVVGVFGYILFISNKSRPSTSAVLGGTKQRHHFDNLKVVYLRTDSEYSPVSKSSGGGSGSSGGGGGFSGGGGGHSF